MLQRVTHAQHGWPCVYVGAGGGGACTYGGVFGRQVSSVKLRACCLQPLKPWLSTARCNNAVHCHVLLQLGPDGSPQHKLCRCCFVVAFAAWLKQLPDNGPDMFKGLDQLHPRQQQQFRDWQRAAAAISSSAGQDFQLPSPQHDKLLRGARLLSGQDWPLEYCSLGGGHTTVRQLMRGVRQLQQVDVPAYSQLPEVGEGGVLGAGCRGLAGYECVLFLMHVGMTGMSLCSSHGVFVTALCTAGMPSGVIGHTPCN